MISAVVHSQEVWKRGQVGTGLGNMSLGLGEEAKLVVSICKSSARVLVSSGCHYGEP